MLLASDDLRAACTRLLGHELLLFPVRHHSPACAWHLQRWLSRVRPCAVLVEGPRSFDPLIPMLVHTDARMPLAVYSYTVFKAAEDESARRNASYYPLCEHSPELVALRGAQALGVPARFIDLDHAEQCQLESADDAAEHGEAHSLFDERHFRRSQHLAVLATKLGCRDHEELWEHLFEAPAATRSFEEHVVNIAAYCQLARSDYSDDELRTDGTLAREQEMAWHIAKALDGRKDGDGPVLAVVGGFHANALLELLASRSITRPAIPRSAISDEGNALIRYSQDRLDRLNGYASGMTSPAWQQRVWEQMLRYEKAGLPAGARVCEELALTMLFDIATELRGKHGLALPMPALAAAYEHVLQLAALRRRPAPVREDVLDAVTSCFVKGDADGDGAIVLAVSRRLLGGQAIGKVPAGASSPPLVRDFEARARRQRLKIDDIGPYRLVLNIYRRPEHRITSRLLHGLSLLGVPLASRRAGPDFIHGHGLDRLQEHWDYTYSAATEAALVEASIYGNTVPLAVSARFAVQLEQHESGSAPLPAKACAALLTQACVLGLHDHVATVSASLVAAIAADAQFASVAAAAGALGLLWESREPLEARGIDALPAMLVACYERAIYLGYELRANASQDQDIVAGLTRLRELLASEIGRALDASLFWTLIDELHARGESAFVRGTATGLAFGAGRLTEAQLIAATEGHLSGLLSPRDAVSFLRGLLQTAREAAWQQTGLLSVLDGLLASWSDETFIANVPELRLAFAEMTPRETDRIAQTVAELHGASDLGQLVNYDLTFEQTQRHLEVDQRVLAVMRADGLSGWVGP